MKIFIKSFLAFKTIAAPDVVSCELCYDSLTADKSSVTVSGTALDQSATGSWAVINEALYIVDSITPGNGTTRLALSPALSFFSRLLPYPGAGHSIGEFLRDVFNSGYVSVSDPVYAINYLQVSTMDTSSAFIPPDVDDNGYFDLQAYLLTVRQLAYIVPDVRCDNERIYIRFAVVQPSEHIVIVGSSLTTLKSAAYSANVAAKITSLQQIDTGNKDAAGNRIYRLESKDWYLSTDGQISNAPPLNRADGTWEVLAVSGKTDAAQKVRERFAKNTRSHKVEFFDARRFAVLDKITLRLNGSVQHSQITYVGVVPGEHRYFYRCGNLAVTASEKIQGGKMND